MGPVSLPKISQLISPSESMAALFIMDEPFDLYLSFDMSYIKKTQLVSIEFVAINK